MFPRAKLVHCVRDALDNCVSCYCTYLPQLEFTHDLQELGRFYREHERLMGHWHAVLGSRICRIRYEDLVTAPQPQIRKLLQYCGLSWHEGCLKPHQTERAVNTVSANQVKAPIHAGSVGRWRKYQAHIGPLIEALGGCGEAGGRGAVVESAGNA